MAVAEHVHEMSRPWFEREARLGLRLICQYRTHAAVHPERRFNTGLEFSSERYLDWFVRDVPRDSEERDYESVRGPMLDFDTWEEAEAWMRSG